MLYNHLKVAFRNLFKQKGLAFINVFGLSIGLACFSLFLLYAVHEFSFDKFHESVDRTYRMYRWTEAMNGEDPEGDPSLPMPLGPAFAQEFPDVEEVVRWKSAWGESFVKINGETSRAEVSHIESNIFDVFNFPLKYGDAQTALTDPRNVVMTEEMALLLFSESNPIGKTIEIQIENNFEPFIVSAVAENIPTNSSLQFQIMGSMEYFESTNYGQRRKDNWGSSFIRTFVKLREGSGLADNEKALLGFREKYYPDREKQLRESGYWTGDGAPVTYKLQPMTAMHMDTSIYGADVPTIESKNVWILLGIAFGVLLIAIINFTTLAIGRSASRAKEVGVRKVIGSTRSSLVSQFMIEAMLLSVISVAIGLAIAQILLPYFNGMADRELVFSFQKFPQLVWMIGGVAIVAGLLAGSYPALMLSGFRPIEVLKNKIKLGGSNLFTKSLVTTQFALSTGLVIATLVIVYQLQYLYSKNPGFNKENIIVVDAEGTDSEKIYPLFKEAAAQEPEILGMAAAELSFGEGEGWSRSGFDYKGDHKEVYEYFIDDDYLSLLNIEIIEGRGFDPNRQDGANRSVIVNESLVKDFGWTNETAVGQVMTGYFMEEEEIQPTVVGVVKDFNYRSYAEEVQPQMFHQYEDYAPFKFLVRIQPGDPARALAKLESSWSELVPGFPFKYSFLDDDLNRFYRAETRFSRIVGWAGGISIFLACLGLLGLAALAAVNRTKEIGIRKVLGASVNGLVIMLSKDFLKLVILALVIASPIAWYFMNNWLDNFAYRVDIEWWVFALAGGAAVLIAFLTVSLQGLKAALVNPVKSLRNE